MSYFLMLDMYCAIQSVIKQCVHTKRMYASCRRAIQARQSLSDCNSVTLPLVGAVCMAEDSLAMQLDEWETSRDTSSQDPGMPPVSTMEESLLFESKHQSKRSLTCKNTGIELEMAT